VIERVAVAGDELECEVVCESILELVPHAVSVLAAVTQLDDQSHRSRATTARVLRAEPTTTTKRDAILVAPPGGKERGSFPPYGWTSKNYVICVCFHGHGTSSYHTTIHCKAVEQRAALIHRKYNRDWGTS